MAQAKTGDTVKVHYTGTLEDGSVFDSSEESCNAPDTSHACGCDSGNNDAGCGCESSGPMEFVIGAGQLIPKFEAAVIGLETGQSITVSIPADEAYGQRVPEMVAVIERSEIPADINPEPGHQMEVILEDGSPFPVLVTEVSDTTITLDGNHPLAGCDLTFNIRLVEIL
ncbi:MAG: peptidylprolyl isomerase [Desulfuromonadaceae bacterium]|nr:peptidylprolyl isomerase [Desulfuromonadaceae bacterium]MDD5104113.1 peptidylprolyl isomerase [Desulfuromonadaceae bacterium]